jgi:hypothetical protein
MQSVLSYNELKAKQRAERDSWPPGVALRTHRALSWLQRAEMENDDPDAAFVFLWIAFNSVYAREADEDLISREHERYENFLKRIIICDRKNRLASVLFDQFSDSLQTLIENKYVLHEYWLNQFKPGQGIDWEKSLNIAVNQASGAQRKRESLAYLMIVLARLRVLRNQVVHGASTWKSSANRQQIQDAAAVMRQIVPVIIDIIMSDPDQDWGDPLYPVQH